MQFIIIVLLLAVLYLLLADRFGGLGALLPGKKRQIILDSCALIDGRIVELVRTGFVADELVVPKFILRELQMLADGNDSHKRERARFGLEVAAELQEYSWISVSISEQNFPELKATDDKLVALAKKTGGVLCTTDFNLNKVASVEEVKVLNINELVQGLRPVALPGERMAVKIVQKGSNHDQGVGYLEDGTMIVVDGAAKQVGSIIEVVTDRMHQTVAGKMVFAHHASDEQAKPKPTKSAAPRRLAEARGPKAQEATRSAQPQQRPTASRQTALASRLRSTQQPRRRKRQVL